MRSNEKSKNVRFCCESPVMEREDSTSEKSVMGTDAECRMAFPLSSA